MFTGIVTDIGTVAETRDAGDRRVRVSCSFDPAQIAIGASIACSGACLTVVERGGTAGDAWFAVDISAESIARTVPGRWEEGTRLNLEPALKLGDELGGHIVTGHVDGVATLVGREERGGSLALVFAAPGELAPFLAPKGSVTLDGVSLTVNEVWDQPDGTCHFGINLIPHTAEVTTLGALAQGDAVNVEIDVLARYLKRMQSLTG